MRLMYLIHQYYPEYYTGTEKFAAQLSGMMQACGHETEIVTYGFFSEQECQRARGGFWLKRFLWKDIPVLALRHRHAPEDLHGSLEDREMEPLAEEIFRQARPDFLHVAHAMRMSAFLAAARKLGVPYGMTLTDFYWICPNYKLVNEAGALCPGPRNGEECRKNCPGFAEKYIQRRRKFAETYLKGARWLVAPSRFLAERFREEFPGLGVEIIPHGLPGRNLAPQTRTYRPGDGLNFVFAGSFNRHKGVHLLVEAFKRVRSDKVRLRLYGSGPDEIFQSELRSAASPDKRIEFGGVFSDSQVGHLFQQADAVVVPSLWYENYPLSLHEALACNLPVIASQAGGMAEKIKSGMNGFLFPLGSVEALSEILQALADHPERLNSVKNSPAHWVPRLEQEASAYLDKYLETMQPAPTGNPNACLEDDFKASPALEPTCRK